MKRHLLITFWLMAFMAAAHVLLIKAAPAWQQQAPDSVESFFTSVVINPNVNLPDNNPVFTCFDMALAVDPAATVVDVEVVVGHTHSWVGDLIYQIHQPDGAHVTLMHRPGHPNTGFGDSSNLQANYPITFGNAYSDDAETMGDGLDNSGVICQDDGRCRYFPNRDEDVTSLASFAGMAGAAAAGTWQFCASDNSAGDTGLLQAVTLHIFYTLPGSSACTPASWQPAAMLNNARSRSALVYSEVTGNFYLLGGEAAGSDWDIPIEAYDPVADAWINKSNLDVGVSNNGAAAVGAYIYVPGGYDGANGRSEMQRYDPAADVVMLMAPLPAVNYAHAVTAHGGKVYVLGGTSTGAVGTTHYIYDVATDNWHTGAPLPTAVQYAAAAADNDYIYVIGGNTTNLATIQRYDPVNDSWDTIPDMNTGRGGAAAFFDGANIWVAGGGWATYLASSEYWDGAAWQPGPPMNSGVRTLGAAYGDGMALTAAGWNGGYVAAVEMMQIECGQSEIMVNPGALSATLVPGQTAARALTISNVGSSDLDWSSIEAPPARRLEIPNPAPTLPDQPPVQPGETLSSYHEYGLPFPDITPPAAVDFPVGPAGGGLTYYADRNAFDADNPGLPVEDFEAGNVAPGAVLACPAPVDLYTANNCFSPGDILPGILFQDDPGQTPNGMALLGENFNNNPSIALAANSLSDALNIYFTAPDVNAVGLDLQSHLTEGPVDITIYAWDGATEIGATTVWASNAGNFWGVATEQPIGRITIHSPTVQAEGVDNIAFGYVGVCATAADIPWASLNPVSGTIAPDASDNIQLTFDATGLPIGSTYIGTLCISSNDPTAPHIELPLTLTVAPAVSYLPVIVR